jgi:hypothetical protein
MTALPATQDRDAFGLLPLGDPVPDDVLAGLAKLASGPPLWGIEIEWHELVERLRAWSCRWHGPTTAAGWDEVALYGVSAEASQVRRELMGGAWMANLRSHQTVAIDRDRIGLVARTAARLSIYRPAAGGVLPVGDRFFAGSDMINQRGIDVNVFQKLRSTGSVRTPEGPDPSRYASQRPTILPKIGSANADANGSQLGSNTGCDKTALKLSRRSPLRARSMEGGWLCRVASAKT